MPPEPMGPGPAVEPGVPGGGAKQVGGHVAALATVDVDVDAGGGDDDAAGAGAAGAGAGAGAGTCPV